jgi:hypothetical protein
MILRNEDIKGLVAEIPEGHEHLRTTLILQDGQEITFQEATVANIVRSYISIKTDPLKKKVIMRGRIIKGGKRGYAEWQLVETGGAEHE